MRRLLPLLVVLLTAACGTPYVPARMPQEVAQPDGSRHVQGQFLGVGKTPLFWQGWEPTKTQKRGVLVVVHGLKDHSSRYADFAHELNKAGYAVYAFDLRGHGNSAGNRVGLLSFEDYVLDLDMFLYRILLAEDVPVFVFGHSMGGAIVTLHSIEYQPAVRGMILSGAALLPGASSSTIKFTKATEALFPDYDGFNLNLYKFSRDPAVVAAALKDPLIYQDGATLHMATELLGGIEKIDGAMDKVRVPLLILHGKADEIAPPAGSKLLYDHTSSTDKRLTLYGSMFHDLLHEPEHEQVTSDIIAWMNARTQ